MSDDPKKRDLQLEAKAHIAVQRWIDEGNLDGRELGRDGLFDIHRQFSSLLPDDLLWVETPKTGKRVRVIPGEQRIGYMNLPEQAPRVLDAILFRGALPRSEISNVIGQSERTARNVTTALSREGIIFSAGPRDDWQIAFPAKLAPRLMPGLFP